MSFFSFDDLDGLTAEYFISEQFVFDPDGNIMGMCVKVFGKSDKGWDTLMLSSLPPFGVHLCVQDERWLPFSIQS